MSLPNPHLSAFNKSDGNVIIKPSKAFKRAIHKAALSLLVFITTYLLLVVFFIGLAFLSFWVKYHVLSRSGNFVTYSIGFTLFILNIGAVYALLKLMLLKNATDRSGMIKLTQEDEPKLFAFIKEITKEIKSPFPKRIYLTPEAGSSIFYDTNFLSVFMPIRPNLRIGLGLVNSTNTNEFKAILARELAPFSKMNMGCGRYIYHANSVIFHMLYDNDGHDRGISKRFILDSIVFGSRSIMNWFIKKIQWVMQQHYTVVNRNYMNLSREIAFHADTVAAVSAGSHNLTTALQRLVPGDLCYAKLLEFYEIWINENIKTDNIYPQHRELMRRFALDNGIEWVNDEMVMDGIVSFNITPRRINIKDQWASHPDLIDRIQHVTLINSEKPTAHLSAWSLFGTPVVLQKEMTAKVYERIEFENEPQTIDDVTFCERIDANFSKQKFDVLYKGYFDTHDMGAFDPEVVCEIIVAADNKIGLHDLDLMLSKDVFSLPKKVVGLQADIRLLDEIIEKNYSVTTFDFDGGKLSTDEARTIRKKLIDELEKTNAVLSDLDKTLFRFFYSKAFEKGMHSSLFSKYREYVEMSQQDSKDLQLIEEMFDVIKPFYAERLTIKQAIALSESVKQKEGEIKLRITSLIENNAYHNFISDGARIAFSVFFEETRPYFEEGFIREEVFALLIDALNAFQEIIVNHKHHVKSSFLNLQLSLFEDCDK